MHRTPIYIKNVNSLITYFYVIGFFPNNKSLFQNLCVNKLNTISLDERQNDDNNSGIVVVYLDEKFTFEIVSYSFVQFISQRNKIQFILKVNKSLAHKESLIFLFTNSIAASIFS